MDLGANLEFQAPVHHTFPLCCLPPIVMSREFIHKCKHGILQYAVVRPIVTIISMWVLTKFRDKVLCLLTFKLQLISSLLFFRICELCDVYGEGSISPNVAFPYIMFINNLSQFVAMYCLVLFYRANKVCRCPKFHKIKSARNIRNN